MAKLASVLTTLRQAEKELEKQLAGIRAAISSLSFGSAASMVPPHAPTTFQKRGSGTPKAAARKKRTMSPEARARIAAAQKKRWAAFRKAQK
jgi:hypothetical protein